MSDTARQAQGEDKLYDPQIAPYIDREADEVTQIGPDGKRHPISELAAQEGSDSTAPEDTPPATPFGEKLDAGAAGEGDKSDAAKAKASTSKAAGGQ
jgi:hypothetical protein